MRLLPILLVVFAASTMAQELTREKLEPRKNQKIERIVVEDAGSRVDELRVGGQTQTITVQPKTEVPAYEIKPTSGARVWNLLRF